MPTDTLALTSKEIVGRTFTKVHDTIWTAFVNKYVYEEAFDRAPKLFLFIKENV